MQPRSRYLSLAGREIHVTEWGPESGETIVMWHGLARTGRDFDPCARHFADRFRVICPDTVGRGLSQWAVDPAAEYCLAFYGRLAVELCDHYGLKSLRWIGTSMGGATGIHLAGGALRERISHLVVNDIGPQLAQPAVERILTYAGKPPRFDTMTELEAYLRSIYKPYGWLSESQWRLMAESSARRMDDGGITLHYDPKMVQQFVHHPQDYDQWQVYDRITAKTLVLRGEESDLLLADWAQEMTRRGPRAMLEQIPGCGHAPALNTAEQLGILERFLGS